MAYRIVGKVVTSPPGPVVGEAPPVPGTPAGEVRKRRVPVAPGDPAVPNVGRVATRCRVRPGIRERRRPAVAVPVRWEVVAVRRRRAGPELPGPREVVQRVPAVAVVPPVRPGAARRPDGAVRPARGPVAVPVGARRRVRVRVPGRVAALRS